MRTILSLLLIAASCFGNQAITFTANATGHTFGGVGILSAGYVSKLLRDYPAAKQSQILDYLFLPNYGAAVQVLKLEIGGDVNAGAGAEASHEHTSGSIACGAGFEFWLALQAKARNPSIRFEGLAWGVPGWTGGFLTTNTQNYFIDWLTCATTTYGLSIYSIGGWNELEAANESAAWTWAKSFRTVLDGAGFSSVKLVMADQTGGNQWHVASAMLSDSALKSAIAIVGAHYPTYTSSTDAQSLYLFNGKDLTDSEDGPWCATWACAQTIGQITIRDFTEGVMSEQIIWAAISSYYAYYSISGSTTAGLMLASTPWSGEYTVQPPIWVMAHTTQFTAPGWKYIRGGTVDNGGHYISYESSGGGTDFTGVFETTGAGSNTTVDFTLAGTLATSGPIHLWKSINGSYFIQQSDPCSSSCATFSVTMVPDAIYTVTTTSGQAKGSATGSSASNFPVPYGDQFECTTAGQEAKYFVTNSGAFEVTAGCAIGSGNCLKQVVTSDPIGWPSANNSEPTAFIGDLNLANNDIAMKFRVPTANATDINGLRADSVKLAARMVSHNQATGDNSDYQFYYSPVSGHYDLRVGNGTFLLLDSGTATAVGAATNFTLKLSVNGASIKGYLNGTQITASVTDSTESAGWAGFGIRGFVALEADDFSISTVGGTPTYPGCAVPSGLGGKVANGGKVTVN